MRLLLLVFFSLNLVACSSWFKKRECNKTNWFTYGEQVAMSGRRLDADGFIGECRKVEADVSDAQLDRGFKKGMKMYCQPQTAYETGRRGKKLSKDLCDGPGWRKLAAKHMDGVKEYCNPNNGKGAGATGVKYNYICPKSMERAFLSEFNKGRKNFLEAEASILNDEIKALDLEITELKRDGRELRSQQANLSRGGSISIRNGFRNIQINESTTPEEREKARKDLDDEVDRVKREVSSKERTRKAKYNELRNLKREMVKL